MKPRLTMDDLWTGVGVDELRRMNEVGNLAAVNEMVEMWLECDR